MSPKTVSPLVSKKAADRLLSFVVFLLIPLCGLLLTNKADPDLWMHLRAGRQIVETHDVPRADLYSFSSAGREWVSHEWLFQLSAFLLFSAAGAAGLMLAKGLVGAGTLRLLYLAIARRSEALVVRSAVFLLAAGVVIPLGFTCRPQIVTYLGFAAISLWLARAEDGHRRFFDLSPWTLVPWSWLHGGFVAGAVLYALIVAAEAAQGRKAARLAAHLILALLATLINPYGLGLWRRLFDTLGTRQLGQLVVEWQPLWATQVPAYRWAFGALAALAAVSFAFDSDRRRRAASWLLAFAGMGAAVYSVRHLLLFAILAAPPIAGGLDRARGRGDTAEPPAWFFACFNGALALIAAGLIFWTFYFTPVVRQIPLGSIVYGEEAPGWVVYPKGAADYIKERRLSGRLWSDVNVGGYLVWHLYPACRVFLDPRLEHVYTPQQMREYVSVMSAAPDWREVLGWYSPDLLLLPRGAPLAAAAGPREGWRRIYSDPDYLLLARGRTGDAPAQASRPAFPWIFP